MNQRRSKRRSLLPFLLLNVVVSALTTLLVLFLWSRAQNNRLPDPIRITTPAAAAAQEGSLTITQTPLPPLPPTETPSIQIINAFGMGDIENEVIVLQNARDDVEIWLDGWQILDEDDNLFTIESLVLNPGASIQIFSKAGYDTVTSLYWNLSEAVWEQGETVTLLDYLGNKRSSFVIP